MTNSSNTITRTIELPEELAARLAEVPEAAADFNAFAVAALEQAADQAEEEPDEELVAALREGLADADAGRLLTLEEVDASIESAFAARRREREQAARQQAA